MLPYTVEELEATGVQPSDIDLARLAAFIDGEGCISIPKIKAQRAKRPVHTLLISITNTDTRLMRWLEETFGGYVENHHNESPQHPKWRSSYVWRITSGKAGALLEKCLPYFVMKRDQAELGIALCKTRGQCYGRGICISDDLYDYRESLCQQIKVLKRPKFPPYKSLKERTRG